MDAKEIFELIKKEYSEDIVGTRFDEEVCEWVDDGWEDDFETELDAYGECGRGEAEGVVIDEMINWYERQYSVELDGDTSHQVHELIKEHYSCLSNA